MSALKFKIPTLFAMKQTIKDKFNIDACSFQLKASMAQLEKYKVSSYERQAVACFAGTGSGKTLAFYIPFLFNDNGISIMVTPLNVLADQMATYTKALGITVANLTGENTQDSVFKEIEAGMHRMIIISPEAIQSNPRFRKIFKSAPFASRLFSIIFDEAHCISQWGDSFRPQYGEVGVIGDLVPTRTIFYVTSATML